MCGLFGFSDYGSVLSQRQKNKLINALSRASEVRGQDATGIAYFIKGKLYINKRALPAHRMRLNVPRQSSIVMGHTRASTQGSERKWYNNHPFVGTTKDGDFAFAHNGVIWNDKTLRQSKHLPNTQIETDSYIAVQLLEQQNALDLTSLGKMAEAIEGSFSFTALNKDGLYFVRGDSPLCLLRFEAGFYLYTSTEEIMKTVIKKAGFSGLKYEEVELRCGDILFMDKHGILKRATFDTDTMLGFFYQPMGGYGAGYTPLCSSYGTDYLETLYDYANNVGISSDDIDILLLTV